MSDIAEGVTRKKEESRRAILSAGSALLMLCFAVWPISFSEIPLGATTTTLSWILASISIVYGISSICRRERLLPLALISVVLSALELCDVLRLVTYYQTRDWDAASVDQEFQRGHAFCSHHAPRAESQSRLLITETSTRRDVIAFKG